MEYAAFTFRAGVDSPHILVCAMCAARPRRRPNNQAATNAVRNAGMPLSTGHSGNERAAARQKSFAPQCERTGPSAASTKVATATDVARGTATRIALVVARWGRLIS